MSADDNSSYLSHTLAYTYDPRDRIATVTKDGTTTESYTHDGSDNVTAQTVGGTTTTFGYDRNRLLTATTGGSTADYNYDPSGRLDTVTGGGQILQSNTYDGFDHIVSHQQQNTSGGTDTTTYTYDPLNRKTSQTTGGKETDFAYLGLSSDLITESSLGSTTKSYDYTPGGARLSQTTHNTDGTTSNGYYSYNDHSDVEAVTGSSGGTTATYGYTAYGQNDKTQFTGTDKNTATGTSTAQPFNAYRYNAMRWDSSTAQYDMGFRTYDPGLNQFLSRDMYNGALADTGLSTDPFTGNRYTFGAGNPITNIEQDGHMLVAPSGGGSTAPASSGCGFLGASCIGHFVSDVAGGFGGTLGGMATGVFHLAIQQAIQPIRDARNCFTGTLTSCLYLGGMTNPLYQTRMGGQLITGAVLGTVQTGKSIYHDFTTGHPGRAIGAIGAYAALFALTRGAGALADDAGVTADEVPAYARSQYGRPTGAQRAGAFDKAPTCPYCGQSPSTQVDHINALKQDWQSGGWADDFATRTGRVNGPGNLIGACQPCNGSKGALPIGPGAGEWWPPGWPAGIWWPFGGP